MKKRLFSILLSLSVMLTGMMAMTMTAMAATDEVTGIQAEQTVDTSSGNIKVTLKVTAEDGYNVEGLALENKAPKGYKLFSGDTTKSVEKLESGKSEILTTVFTKESGAVKTGDSRSNHMLIYGGIAVLSAALIVLLLSRKKGRNKVFMLLLCCVMVASGVVAFTGEGFAGEGNQINLSEDVTVGSETVTVNSVVSYDSIQPTVETVEDVLATVEDFPTSDSQATVPDNAWTAVNGNKCYRLNDSLCFCLPAGFGLKSIGLSNNVVKSGNDYIYSKDSLTVTFKMKEDKLVSITFNGDETFNGTYAPVAEYNVTFDLNGITGTTPTAQKIKDGEKVTKPADPTDTIHTFAGWYKTKDATTGALSDPWDFDNDTVTADMTLYAKWTRTLESIYTNSDIPKVTDNTAPDDAWVCGENGKAFIAFSTGNTVLMLNNTKTLSCRKTENFTKIGDDYVLFYELSGKQYGVFTLHMTEGKFTSVTYNGAGTDYEVLSGTYAAPPAN